MTRWLAIRLVLLLFAATGCDVVATAITTRAIDATDDIEGDASPLHIQRPLQQDDLHDGKSPDQSKLSGHILTPVALADAEKKTGYDGDSLPVQGSEPAVAFNEVGPADEKYDTQSSPPNGDERTSQIPDETPTIEPALSPPLMLVPTPYDDGSILGEAAQIGPTTGEVIVTSETRQDCVRPGGMTLWLEPLGGKWTVVAGQSIEVNLCLSNLYTDLAGFDLVLNLGRGDVAEFTEASIGGFGLKIHSELPSASLRVRAIDLMQKLNAETDGISLATLQISGTGVGESPLSIEIKAIDDNDGYSVTAEVLGASIQVTEG